jgi:hypothetical protein
VSSVLLTYFSTLKIEAIISSETPGISLNYTTVQSRGSTRDMKLSTMNNAASNIEHTRYVGLSVIS